MANSRTHVGCDVPTPGQLNVGLTILSEELVVWVALHVFSQKVVVYFSQGFDQSARMTRVWIGGIRYIGYHFQNNSECEPPRHVNKLCFEVVLAASAIPIAKRIQPIYE